MVPGFAYSMTNLPGRGPEPKIKAIKPARDRLNHGGLLEENRQSVEMKTENKKPQVLSPAVHLEFHARAGFTPSEPT